MARHGTVRPSVPTRDMQMSPLGKMGKKVRTATADTAECRGGRWKGGVGGGRGEVLPEPTSPLVLREVHTERRAPP